MVLDTSGGVYHGYLFGNRGPNLDDEVALDNLTINATVPEPATWAMMLVGFTGLGIGLYRQRKKTAAAWAR